jgi:hypothetical protein
MAAIAKSTLASSMARTRASVRYLVDKRKRKLIVPSPSKLSMVLLARS